jgi:hypothetical protein
MEYAIIAEKAGNMGIVPVSKLMVMFQEGEFTGIKKSGGMPHVFL